MQHLANLDELINKIRRVSSRKYISEAITCYRVGSYRAAIILSWQTVCSDIIEKIKELSSHNNREAIIFVDNLTNAIESHNVKKLQEVEKDLVNIACNQFQFISIIEKKHLDNLYDDRNYCAHPSPPAKTDPLITVKTDPQ